MERASSTFGRIAEMTNDLIVLKPCPFCGGDAATGANYGVRGGFVQCVNVDCPCNPEVFVDAIHNADASLSLEAALEKAKNLWNTRA
jgi:Restriction alleviation protein Lar